MSRVYVNRLLIEIIRPILADLDSPKPIMVTKLPSDITPHLDGGLVYARKSAGAALHPKFSESASVQVDCYASDEDKAEALASLVDQAIYDAWWDQLVYPHGHIARHDVPTTPFDFPDQLMPADVVRYMAEYELVLRPPSA
jgi:hypothetical protein